MSASRRPPLWCSSMGQRPPYERSGDLGFQRADNLSLMLPSSTDTLSSGVRGVEWDHIGLCVICLCYFF